MSRDGDRVGTFCWNTQEHLEAYFAIPCIGAVLHTLNIRLFPEQLAYVINHAEDRVVIVDDSLIPVLARVVDDLETVERFIVVGDGDASALGDREVLRYHELLAAEHRASTYPELDERQAAAMCYTSGTTGNPKGVAYSHRSSYLHSLVATTPTALGLSERDRVLTIVPMFHANAWGIPYASFICGASVVMPGRFLQAEPLTTMIAAERVTFSGAVPTIWADILRYGDEHEIDLSTLRMIICGGSAVPRALMDRLMERYGVPRRAGLGHDGDVAARRGLARAGVGRLHIAGGGRLASDDRPRRRRRRAAHRRRRRATRCRGTAKRSARSKCAGRGSPPRTTATTRPRSSTTVGCAPATSVR